MKIIIVVKPRRNHVLWTATPLVAGPEVKGYSSQSDNIVMDGLVLGAKYNVVVTAAGRGNNNNADKSDGHGFTTY